MKVKDIIKVIEDFAPLSVQEGWDNSGLCVGSPEDEVTSILLALDCTPALVDEAVACGADMIITVRSISSAEPRMTSGVSLAIDSPGVNTGQMP